MYPVIHSNLAKLQIHAKMRSHHGNQQSISHPKEWSKLHNTKQKSNLIYCHDSSTQGTSLDIDRLARRPNHQKFSERPWDLLRQNQRRRRKKYNQYSILPSIGTSNYLQAGLGKQVGNLKKLRFNRKIGKNLKNSKLVQKNIGKTYISIPDEIVNEQPQTDKVPAPYAILGASYVGWSSSRKQNNELSNTAFQMHIVGWRSSHLQWP